MVCSFKWRKAMKWVDVSLALRENTVHWPGHPRYTVTHMMSMDEGDAMNVTAIAMCSHFGTHIDAPRHYVASGAPIDQITLDILVGPCRVVAYTGAGNIPGDFIQSLDLDGVRRLLIWTNNSLILDQSEFHDDYIALTVEAAKIVVDRGEQLLGMDGYSLGPFEPELGRKVHQIFLGASPDRVAIEEIDLSKVDPGDYQLIALPIKLAGLESAPMRVLLGKE